MKHFLGLGFLALVNAEIVNPFNWTVTLDDGSTREQEGDCRNDDHIHAAMCGHALTVPGCTETTACNHNPSATEDDGSCTYPTESYLDCSGNCVNDINNDSVCDETQAGCTNPDAVEYNPDAVIDDFSCYHCALPVGVISNYGSTQGAYGEEHTLSCDTGYVGGSVEAVCGGSNYGSWSQLPTCTVSDSCNKEEFMEYDPNALNNNACRRVNCSKTNDTGCASWCLNANSLTFNAYAENVCKDNLNMWGGEVCYRTWCPHAGCPADASLGIGALEEGGSDTIDCPSGQVGSRTVTCTEGATQVEPVESACRPLSDFTDAAKKQQARLDLKSRQPDEAKATRKASYGETSDTTTSAYKSARKSALKAAKLARRDYLTAQHEALGGGDAWKNLVVEDTDDFEGYSDAVLAKRQAKLDAKRAQNPSAEYKIRYRAVPTLTGGCDLNSPDLVLTKEDGIDVVDPEDCVTIGVDGEQGVIKMTKNLEVFDLECNDGTQQQGLDIEAEFTCHGRVWDIGSVSTDANDVYGCTDPLACNYDASATVDDGSCVSATGCDRCSGETDGTGTVEAITDADDDGVCDDVDPCIGTCTGQPVQVKHNGTTYEACEGTYVEVIKNGNHNIWEVKEGGNEAVIEPLSTNTVKTSLLGAQPGDTREFYCSAHTGAKFYITCPAEQNQDSEEEAPAGPSTCPTDEAERNSLSAAEFIDAQCCQCL